jgi:biotin operon repressor
MSKAKMAQFLRQVGIDVEAKDKRGNRVWRIPRIEDARIKFQEWIGGELNWEE